MRFPFQGHVRVDQTGFGSGGGAVFLFLFLVVLAVVVLVLLISLRKRGQLFGVRGVAHANVPLMSTLEAMGILNERLARGDIDAEDYTARRDLLQGHP